MVGALMKVHVIVMPKAERFGSARGCREECIEGRGLDTVESVRVGKFLELEFRTPPSETKLEEICRDLLSNPVIEDYTIQSPLNGRVIGMKIAVVQFPGSNCDQDCLRALTDGLRRQRPNISGTKRLPYPVLTRSYCQADFPTGTISGVGRLPVFLRS